MSAALSENQCSDYLENDPGADLQKICMDRVFNVSYKVLEVFSGSHKGGIIEAIDFYHYSGLPDHLTIDPACVTFGIERGEYIHRESPPVIKTKNGYSCASAND